MSHKNRPQKKINTPQDKFIKNEERVQNVKEIECRNLDKIF
jgi:hypothetical protein